MLQAPNSTQYFPFVDPSPLQSFYGRSRRRLLVFDYDGTLVAHHALAQLSAPPPVLLQVLEALCEVRHSLHRVATGYRTLKCS